MKTFKGEPKTLTVTWYSPDRERDRAMSGLEWLKAVQSGEMPPPPMAALMGIDRIVEVEPGRVVFSAPIGGHLYNGGGVVHGGFAATLFDTALGTAIFSKLPAGVGCTTTDLHVRYLKALTVKTGRVFCEAKVIHVGRSTATAEARLTDENGVLYAHATTACAILRE
ncbi:MAG TPA: PaaI family thioesterase [Candidatus Tumulicola sp.]|nr:PaaI family thioesterase [Candidatus Tumulicola sp.]